MESSEEESIRHARKVLAALRCRSRRLAEAGYDVPAMMDILEGSIETAEHEIKGGTRAPSTRRTWRW